MMDKSLILIFKLLFLIIVVCLTVFFITDQVEAAQCFCRCDSNCFCPDAGPPNYACPCCEWCDSDNCSDPGSWECGGCDYCTSCGGGCFTGETEVGIKGTEGKEETNETKEIKELKPGDFVSSFDPETGEVKEGTVSNIQELTREGYYELETESGKKVRVTAEHPFLAFTAKNSKLKTENSKLIDDFKDFLSNTLTYQLIAGLQAKMSEVLK